jgi:hypothetical protein
MQEPPMQGVTQVVQDLKVCTEKLEQISAANQTEEPSLKKIKLDIEFLKKEVADIKKTLQNNSDSDSEQPEEPAKTPLTSKGVGPSQSASKLRSSHRNMVTFTCLRPKYV